MTDKAIEIVVPGREQLAELQHDIWAHWMRYMFSCCGRNEDGSLVIPGNLAKRWASQADTDYADLSEAEKDSDREQADKLMPSIAVVHAAAFQVGIRAAQNITEGERELADSTRRPPTLDELG